MFKRSIIPAFVLFAAASNVQAQHQQCGGHFDAPQTKVQVCSQSSAAFTSSYKQQSFYIPGTNPFVDEVRVPINLIVLADDNGDYGAYTPAQLSSEVHAYTWLNEAHVSTSLPSDPVPGYPASYWLDETKIVFEPNEVYFYNNSSYFNAAHPTGVNQLLADHFTSHPEAVNFVNCFLVKNGLPGAGGYASTYNGTPIIVTTAWDDPATPATWQSTSAYWYWGNHLPHEMGHLFQLMHTYAPGGCCSETTNPANDDFLEDVFFDPAIYENPCSDPWVSPTDFCTNNLMSGKQLNHFISPLQAGRCHRNLRRINIRNFAYGYSGIPHEITADETWDFIYKSYNDIIIKSGVTLTLTCRLEMVKDAKIIIEAGGKLIVDGATITSARSAGPDHEGFWQGIEVWGNSSLYQNSTNQGTLITLNNALIENAKEAIRVWKPNDWSSTGGIVNCNSTTFRNNWRSCEYIGYHNMYGPNPSIEILNTGLFQNCVFEWTDGYTAGNYINTAITMFHVNGVRLTGCDFVDHRVSGPTVTRTKGIGTLDAGFRVTGTDLNPGPVTNPNVDHYYDETDFDIGLFQNLAVGIEAENSSASYPITIDHVRFFNNEIGVELDAINLATVTRNKFTFDNTQPAELDGSFGLVVRNSTGYKIEGNLFDRVNSTELGVGTAIFDSGMENNAVYRNKFNGLTIANYAYGYNSNDLSGLSSAKGLEWRCNEMTNNYTDLVNYVNSYSPAIDGEGVKALQGTASNPAGNKFSQTITSLPPLDDAHINHGDQDLLAYHYYTADAVQQPTVNVGNISVSGTGTAPTCISSFGGGIIRKSDVLSGEVSTLSVQLEETERELQKQQSLFDDLYLRAGNDELLQLLGRPQVSENELYDKLLAGSPFLSTEVLRKAGELSPQRLSHSRYAAILKANPEVMITTGFMDFLRQKQHPLPETMLLEVGKPQNILSERGRLEITINELTSERDRLINAFIRQSVAADEINYEYVQALISKRNHFLHSGELFDLYLSSGQLEKARETLLEMASFDGTYPLNRMEQETHDLIAYNQYLLSQPALYGTLGEISNEQLDMFRYMADQYTGVASRKAKNFLCFFTGECDPVRIMLNENTNEAGSDTRDMRQEKVSVFPNPNNGQFIVRIPEGSTSANILFTDVSGKMIPFSSTMRSENETEIKVSGVLRPGVYFIAVNSADGTAFVSKVMIR